MTRRNGRRSRGVGPSSAVLVKRLSWSRVLKVSGGWEPGNLSAGLRPGGRDDDGQLNQPLPGGGLGGELAGGSLAGGARWTSAGLALKPPAHEAASVRQMLRVTRRYRSCARGLGRHNPEFTLVMVTVRPTAMAGVPAIRRVRLR